MTFHLTTNRTAGVIFSAVVNHWLVFVINASQLVPAIMDIFAKKYEMFVKTSKVEHHDGSNESTADTKTDVSDASCTGRFQRWRLSVSAAVATCTDRQIQVNVE